eukprot:Skav209489  [mRNA]  locus=scaffold1892:208113:212439:- [translate_table: standard]
MCSRRTTEDTRHLPCAQIRRHRRAFIPNEQASLMRTVLGQQKTTVAHISMLQEMELSAKNENANEDLILQASKLIARLSSESEVQKRISATVTWLQFCLFLCVLDSFRMAQFEVLYFFEEEMPDWSQHTEKFEEFHEDIPFAETFQGSASRCKGLDKIERLLVEKKQTEAEMGLKAWFVLCPDTAKCGSLNPNIERLQKPQRRRERNDLVGKLSRCVTHRFHRDECLGARFKKRQ